MTTPQLHLERKAQTDNGVVSPAVSITPRISEDYWAYRVKLSDSQAILGFPKFGTIGIGFAQEEDWNTNLPFTCTAAHIFEHIKHNKGDDAISDEDALAAIQLVQDAIRADRRSSDDLAGRIDSLDLDALREAVHWLARNVSRDDVQRAVGYAEGLDG